MSLQKALALGLGCALFNLVGARLLDSMGLVEGLLAPSGARLWLLVPVASAFYAVRLLSYFVLPGLIVATLCSRADERRGSRYISRRETP